MDRGACNLPPWTAASSALVLILVLGYGFNYNPPPPLLHSFKTFSLVYFRCPPFLSRKKQTDRFPWAGQALRRESLSLRMTRSALSL
jgi:hypothetical protein